MPYHNQNAARCSILYINPKVCRNKAKRPRQEPSTLAATRWSLLQLYQVLQTSLDAHILSLFGVVPSQNVYSHDCGFALQLHESVDPDTAPAWWLLCGLPILRKRDSSRLKSSLDSGVDLAYATERCARDLADAGVDRKAGFVRLPRDLDRLLASCAELTLFFDTVENGSLPRGLGWRWRVETEGLRNILSRLSGQGLEECPHR